jgi:hypothetical protein
MPELIFIKTWYVYHGNRAHLSGVLHKSLPSVCVSVCVSLLSLQGDGSVECNPPFSARQRLSKHIPAATNIPSNRRTGGRVVLFVVRVVPKESRPLFFPRTSCLSVLLISSYTDKIPKGCNSLKHYDYNNDKIIMLLMPRISLIGPISSRCIKYFMGACKMIFRL